MTGPAVVLVDIDEIDMATAPGMEEILRAAGEASSLVILDMSRVSFLSAAGIGVLVTAQRSLQDMGGDLVLAGCRTMTTRVLCLCRLRQSFVCYSSVDAALDVLGAEVG